MISVICPTYGRVRSLEEAIYSFLNQTYIDSEMIIVNDFNKQKLFFDHPRIKIYNFDNRFSYLSRKKNIMAKLCKGDIILPLDDDDILLPNYLESVIKYMQNKNWLLPMRTFVYNKTINSIQITDAVALNTFVYKKDVLKKCDYGKRNFNINQPFIHQVQRNFSGRIVKFPLENIGYIARWDENQRHSYHTRLIGQSYKNDQERYKKIDNYLNNQIKFKLISTGDINLNPHWQKDYISLTKNFVKSIENSILY